MQTKTSKIYYFFRNAIAKSRKDSEILVGNTIGMYWNI